MLWRTMLIALSITGPLSAQWTAPREVAFARMRVPEVVGQRDGTLDLAFVSTNRKGIKGTCRHSRSGDHGETWGPVRRCGRRVDDGLSSIPGVRLAAEGDTIHGIAQNYSFGGESFLNYFRSDDGGATWRHQHRLGEDFPRQPWIAVHGEVVHLTWLQANPDNVRQSLLLYGRSLDGGVSWSEPQRLAVLYGGAPTPDTYSFAVRRRSLHLVWSDPGPEGELASRSRQIFHRASRNAGRSWEPLQRLGRKPGTALEPSVAVDGRAVHVVWSLLVTDPTEPNPDRRDRRLRYVRSNDRGRTWGRPSNVLSSGLERNRRDRWPRIAAADGVVHLIWRGSLLPGLVGSLFYVRSPDRGRNWGSVEDASLGLDVDFYSLAISERGAHVFFSGFQRGRQSSVFYRRREIR